MLRRALAIISSKDKHHAISPLSGTQSTKQTSKQNRTRDMEIKNKLTVTKAEGKGGNREKNGKGQVREHV